MHFASIIVPYYWGGGNGPISIIYGAHTRNVTKFGFYYCPILFDMTDTDLKDHGEKGLDQ